jgi:cytochrome P450
MVVDESGLRPSSAMDFWSEEVLASPFSHYKELRDLGPAVWLSRHDAWAVTRHASVRAALMNAQVFSSARGCTMNEATNRAMEGVMLCSDEPVHRKLRRVFARPLLPEALAPLKERLVHLAQERVEVLLEGKRFDAVTQLAHFLPLTVVTELVGLSDEGKANMLNWAAAVFNAFGPDTHERTLTGINIMHQAVVYLQSLSRESLDPNGWGAALFAAADRGEVSLESARAMLMDYLAPSLDTTINATSAALWLFAQHPDQWSKIRKNPALIPQAIDEVLRLESPIRAFARYAVRDCDLLGTVIPAGSRALMVYASANRDERRYVNPDSFDIERNARDHVAFGHGTHMCAGMHLARLEITVLLETLARRVEHFHLLGASRLVNNTLWGFSRLDVEAKAA